MNAKAQRGSALLETILLLPVLIGITLLAADMYILHQARSYLQQSAHNVASVIGAQGKLDANGLRALIEQAASTQVLHNYEMIISKVESDRSMQWRPLHRGPAQGLCTAYSEGRRYTGVLPEELPEARRRQRQQSLGNRRAGVPQQRRPGPERGADRRREP
ncbi:pilus assembly protein [Pseudomonas sp. MAFF212428]|uniref:Pilus assembly protein n=1 Tax=Pseudomonas brassicae TaxID=2708063 RepID=A0A6M0CXU8_9PSED|nr:pilus assembly protein [Pseudomonas brassicae]